MSRIAPVLTPERTQQRNDAANQKRRENSARLLRDFPEELQWRRRADELDIVMPRYAVPTTPAAIEKWLRVLGIDPREYRKREGGGTLAEIAERYDRECLPLRAWVGRLILNSTSAPSKEEEQPELQPVYCKECGKLLLPGLIAGASVLHCGQWNYPGQKQQAA